MPGRITFSSSTVFYVYAQEEEALCSQLEKHLSLLQRQGLLTTWHHGVILPGDEWKQQIDDHLNQAQIILLFLSANFLASDFCYEYAMQHAMTRQRQGTARVIPILLRPCDWSSAPFGTLQALPRNGKPVASWNDADEAFADIALQIRHLLEQPKPPESISSAHADQNRERMQQRLKRWYQDFLSQSLQGAAWLDLGLLETPDALAHPITLLIREAHVSDRPLPPGTSIVQVYEEAHQELLILGEPGAGKSTHLYVLGKHLLTLTESNPIAPLPFVFPLSSWANKKDPLETWMAQQLVTHYRVPKWVASHWIQSHQIIPLLDGLDELEEAARPGCIEEINRYHQEHFSPLVVCSRSAEYMKAAQHIRFELHYAVVVQPLSEEQIRTTIHNGGRPLFGLRTALKNNRALLELAQTPLLLNLLILTYQGLLILDLPEQGNALLEQVLHAYIDRMIRRKGDTTRYPHEVTIHWLHALATQMRRHNLIEWEIEQLQPDWLPRNLQWWYRWSVGLSGGLSFGLIFGLSGGLSFGLIFGLIFGLGVGLIFGLKVGLSKTIRMAKRMEWSWKEARSGLSAVLIIGLRRGLILGLILGLIFGLLIGLSVGLHRGLLVGLFVGLVIGLISGLILGLIFGLLVGLFVGLVIGLNPKQLVDRSALIPGNGLSRTIKNGLLVGLGFGLIFGVSGGVSGGQRGELLVGLLVGLGFGLLAGLLVGLEAYLQYAVLRFWLWSSGSLPLRLVPFLEDAKARHLLKRVGGTYQFMHRLLLEYFADLEPRQSNVKNPSNASTDPQSLA